MDSEAILSAIHALLALQLNPVTPGIITGIAVIVLLLVGSAAVSGSEVAFFSINPGQRNKLMHMHTNASHRVLKLLAKPERLLATILISNNFINIGIVIISTFLTAEIFDFSHNPVWAFVIQVVVVTFLILLIGEIIPKLYANHRALRFSLFISYPLMIIDKLFAPLSNFLIASTSLVNKKLASKKSNISMVDLSDALDLTTGVVTEEKKILKSIVRFSNIEVDEIMRPRMDVVAADINTELSRLTEIVNESGYSRIPVYSETFDNVKGILYVKDLLPHLEKSDSFDWQSLIRPSYYVPGGKKINILLQEFREKKIHLAIVVDEYGGTEGIVTLEDILEEIVGEITDESDEVESFYTKIDDRNYVFDGKVLLNDFYKSLGIQEDIFEKVKGDADTLAGLLLEVLGDIPAVNEKFTIDPFTFTINSVDNRRIKKIKVTLDKPLKTK
ncbi:MAG TPA: gliding motility-associated protein GldE [Bacteroidales bacterium]|nr:gliding motility-associated protein GldE [Bacteroidales bacterium]